MRMSDCFPSKYVKAGDLNGKTVTLTIKAVTLEEMTTHKDEKAIKPVVWFERATKAFVLNRTNGMAIAALYGDESDNWVGKRISIYPTKVRAFGTVQDCIRVREEIPAVPMPAATAAPVEEPAQFDDDEDVVDVDNPFDDGQA